MGTQGYAQGQRLDCAACHLPIRHISTHLHQQSPKVSDESYTEFNAHATDCNLLVLSQTMLSATGILPRDEIKWRRQVFSGRLQMFSIATLHE